MTKKQINFINVIKLSAGGLFGCLFASLLGLSYSTSAGVIAILSVQNTRRETLSLIAQRILAFFIALLIALGAFSLLGYTLPGVFLYLVFFAGICSLFSMENAFVMNTVLIFHFFAEQSMSPSWVLNELCLLLTGAGCGILMNLYMPENAASIRTSQRELENLFGSIFLEFSLALLKEPEGKKEKTVSPDSLALLMAKLSLLEKQAFDNYGNSLLIDQKYFIKYVEMRKNQEKVLENLKKNLSILRSVPVQAYKMSEFLQEISTSFHEYNNAVLLMERLEEIMAQMKEEPLPKTRKEFENRAVLYRILYDLEEFLQLKNQFVANLSEKEIKRFWNDCCHVISRN